MLAKAGALKKGLQNGDRFHGKQRCDFTHMYDKLCERSRMSNNELSPLLESEDVIINLRTVAEEQ